MPSAGISRGGCRERSALRLHPDLFRYTQCVIQGGSKARFLVNLEGARLRLADRKWRFFGVYKIARVGLGGVGGLVSAV